MTVANFEVSEAGLAIYESALDNLIPIARQLLDVEQDFGATLGISATRNAQRARLSAIERLAEDYATVADALPTLLAVALLRLAEQENTR